MSTVVSRRRFPALFGVIAEVCAMVGNTIERTIPHGAKPCHLLWALMILKVCATEHTNGILSGADKKTFRKCIWIFVCFMSELEVKSAD